MTPIPNGSTPSAEPQGRNPEQTTGAAVGGVSARIHRFIIAATPGDVLTLLAFAAVMVWWVE